MSKYSGFEITFNTNQTDHKYIEPVKELMKEFVRNDLTRYIKYQEREPEPEKIESIKIHLPPECEPDYTQGKDKKIHIHFIMEIHHDSKIHIETRKMARDFAKKLNLPSVYVNAKFIPESDIERVMEYNSRHYFVQHNLKKIKL